MRAERTANNLEKHQSKIEELNFKFNDESAQADFDSMKSDVIANLEEMIQLIHEDAESEETNDNEANN